MQTQLLLTPDARGRATAVAVASGYVRAEVLRRMVDSGLRAWEKEYADNLSKLDVLAARFDMTRAALVEAMSRDKLQVADLEECTTYPGEGKD